VLTQDKSRLPSRFLSIAKRGIEKLSELRGKGKQIASSHTSASLAKSRQLSIAMALLRGGVESVDIGNLSEKLNIREDLLLDGIEKVEESAGIKRTRRDATILSPAGEDRLKLAIVAVTLGATIEESASALTWKEFESFCVKILEENGYSCAQEYRFKSILQKRFECDILAAKNPLIVMGDCKHYAGRVKGLGAVAKKQMERVNALTRSVSTMVRSIPGIADWREAIVLPVIITLFPENTSILDGVPVVPGFKLNQFIQELPLHTDRIACVIIHPSTQERLSKNAPTWKL
jgi:hypothetical protein